MSSLHVVEWRYILRKLYDLLIIIHLLIVMHFVLHIDFSYTDRVRHNSARISLFLKFSIFRKFVFVFVSGFTAFAFVFVFKCKSRKRLRGFLTVFFTPNGRYVHLSVIVSTWFMSTIINYRCTAKAVTTNMLFQLLSKKL